MPVHSVQRKLAAILAADVVGYSRLMGEDEAGTLARLKEHRRDLIDPKVSDHKGRIVKTTGDGILIEFPSVVEAVACAIAVQRGMAERNVATPEAQRIDFRIGINLGDIISDDDDIFGDGVNVAARLEALAEPGGICVNRVVRDQVRDKLDIAFEDMGEQQVKNIARPVRAFRVVPEAKSMLGSSALPPTLALPDKPSLAVLPFQNMSGDPEQEYFADGMVEEITTAISRLPWLFVIARNSAFTYKGKPIDVKQVGRELGVRYVLEGSVRKGGNRVRITGQLIDTTTGAHIWADRFDGALDDIFELQDQVASSVAGVIEPKLRQSEIERAVRKPTDHLDAYDLFLRALAQTYRYTEQGFREAVVILQRALAIDPSYAPAAALLAFSRTQQRAQGWGALSDVDLAEAVRLARLAVAVERGDPDVMWQAAWTLFRFAGDTTMAMALLDRAVSLNSNGVMAWVVKGWVHAMRNQPDPAIEAFERALRLSPFDPIRFYTAAGTAYAHLAAHRFEAAIEWADRSLHDAPTYMQPLQVKIAANAHLGRLPEARTALDRLLAILPGLTIAKVRTLFGLSTAPEVLDLVFTGERLAGLPEGKAP